MQMPTVAHRSRFLLPIAAAILLIAVVVPIPSAGADVTFVVDVVADDGALSACTLAPGDCSLRGAVAAANANAGVDAIDFLIPAMQCPGGICRITLTNGPIEVAEAVTIDATTQPQNGGPQANVCATSTEPSYMRVEVVADPTAGLYDRVFQITHATGSSTIRGFAFGDSSGAYTTGAINVTAGSGHHIACNHFALDAAGQNHLGAASFFAGILVDQSANGVIIGTDGDGVDDVGERNVFASGGYPLYINANNNNTVAGNYFGFAADGATAIGTPPVLIRQSSSNTIVGTNEDGVSDELERNYFGNSAGSYSLFLPATGVAPGIDQRIVGNTFGVSPTGAITNLQTAIEVTSLDADETGWEIRDNVFVAADTAVAISGSEPGAGVLIADNVFGVGPGDTSVPNGDAISLLGSGLHTIRDNLVANSTGTGISTADSAGFTAASSNNCVVGNAAGASSSALSSPDLENNWWGSSDGPSGVGSGSGDPVGGNVDFTPWLANPPAMCNSAPVADDATFAINAGASIGTLVGVATATDDGADLTFEITAGDPGGVFGVDPQTGEVVILGTPDYPTTTSYSLTMKVVDTSSLSDTATITVDITNQVPVATDAAFTIAETAAIGATVGTVAATDGDSDSLVWSIAAGDPGSVFSIDGDGLITVAGSLDYETTPSYSLTVEVSDGFESDTAAVTVTVTDVFEAPTTPTFDDVPLGHTFYTDIEWLAAEGVTKGCNPPDNDLFCPDASVTRGQMAAFLHRALAGTLTAGPSPDFTDIDKSVFTADIDWLGAVGVTRGCNPPTNDLFCPDAVVTREQMAAFLVRALGYTAGAGSDQFRDDDNSIFEADIERLAEAGVTRGCNPPTNDLFCPTAAVTRAQMAAFLHRALGP
jgi:hypothetical protein